MKIIFLHSLVLVILIVATTSCNKNDATPDPVPPASLAPTLVKIFELDTTLTVPKDTIGRYSFTYDALNRPLLSIYFGTKPNGDTSDYATTQYYYNGNDTPATKVIETDKYFSSPTTIIISKDTNYYTYLNGKRASDSVPFSGNGYSVNKYTYLSNTIKLTKADKSGTNSSTGSSTFYQTKVNDNITYQLDTLVDITAGSPTIFYQRFEANISYLPNPNPYYKIGMANHREYLYDDLSIGGVSVQKNLPLQQTSSLKVWNSTGTVSGGFNNHQANYTYTFRSDGYPLIARRTFFNGTTTQRIKFVFVYQ